MRKAAIQFCTLIATFCLVDYVAADASGFDLAEEHTQPMESSAPVEEVIPPQVEVPTPTPTPIPVQPEPKPKPKVSQVTPVHPFTGRVTKSRVRMRVGSDLHSPILIELDQGDLVGIDGEEGDFYAVLPPKGTKGFVFRTYVLQDVVEGSHVNVRLEPSLEAPVIAQLNSGDKVQGTVSPLNSRWLEIEVPTSVRFFVAKNFVEKAGDAQMLTRAHRRRDDATDSVNKAYIAAQMELQKPFEEINLDKPIAAFKSVIHDYSDIPNEVTRAQHFLTLVEDAYQQKKLKGLQSETSRASSVWRARNQELAEQVKKQQEQLNKVEQQLNSDSDKPVIIEELTIEPAPQQEVASQDSVGTWLAQESHLFDQWLNEHPSKTMEDYYAQQTQEGVRLRGILQAYDRPVKNRPGDYILLNPDDNHPVAFLYSTKVDLNDKLGKVVALDVVERPNNDFAFPAYFVLQVK